jgi:hypothetical protein
MAADPDFQGYSALETSRVSASSPKEHSVRVLWQRGKPKSISLNAQLRFRSGARLLFSYREYVFVIWLASSQHVEDDSSKLVGCCCHGFGRSRFGPHAAEEVSEPRFAPM